MSCSAYQPAKPVPNAASHCLGAALARLEGQIAIHALLARAPQSRLAVAPGALRWQAGLVLRGLKALPVTLGP